MMKLARGLAGVGAGLIVAACDAGSPLGPQMVVLPGKDRSEAAFRQDEAVCQQHAIAHTGYGDLSQHPAQHPAGKTPATPAPGASGDGLERAAAPSSVAPADGQSYVQCMAARGNIVQMASVASYNAGYASVYPYAPPYSYPYGYGYADPFAYPIYGGFVGGLGWFHGGGWHHGWGHRHGWHNGGWSHGGFHGGGGGRHH
jgi:hypothetical protein